MTKLLSLSLLLFSGLSLASSGVSSYSYQLLAKELSIPWGLEFVDDNTLLITEKSGDLKKLNLTTGKVSLLQSFEMSVESGQGGLLDIARSVTDSSKFYITYSAKTNQGNTTALAVASYINGALSEFEPLMISDAASSSGHHFGSRIAFDNKGHIFFSIGDRGERENAQNTTNHAGSIIRLSLDGSVPTDNPFVGNKNIRDEIWSYGHRNPQGLYFDMQTENLWSIEHGPRGGDEINLIKKGANYGWPLTSHGKEYWGPIDAADHQELDGIESPKLVYIPSIAPSSLVLYRGEKYPELNGKLLAGALKLTHINVIEIGSDGQLGETQRLAENLKQRIRDIAVSPSGTIVFSTDNGNIYRLVAN